MGCWGRCPQADFILVPQVEMHKALASPANALASFHPTQVAKGCTALARASDHRPQLEGETSGLPTEGAADAQTGPGGGGSQNQAEKQQMMRESTGSSWPWQDPPRGIRTAVPPTGAG